MFVVLLIILAVFIVFKLCKSWNTQYTFRVDYEGEPVVITSQRIPPNFRKAKFKDEVDMLFGTCGMCKHFDRKKNAVPGMDARMLV